MLSLAGEDGLNPKLRARGLKTFSDDTLFFLRIMLHIQTSPSKFRRMGTTMHRPQPLSTSTPVERASPFLAYADVRVPESCPEKKEKENCEILGETVSETPVDFFPPLFGDKASLPRSNVYADVAVSGSQQGAKFELNPHMETPSRWQTVQKSKVHAPPRRSCQTRSPGVMNAPEKSPDAMRRLAENKGANNRCHGVEAARPRSSVNKHVQSLRPAVGQRLDILVPDGSVIVPMGQYCATASFLDQLGWRRQAFPLDWSCHTLKVWKRVLEDDFTTLLDTSADANIDRHPYDFKYQDTTMFVHQRGWSNSPATQAALRRRIGRLRSLLEQRLAFGRSFYFSGSESIHSSITEIVNDARNLRLQSHGFFHAVLVWFDDNTSRRPPASWSVLGDGLCLLRYKPFQRKTWFNEMHPVDVACLAKLLVDRFPAVFVQNGQPRGGNDSGEEDADANEGTGVNWIDHWDFKTGYPRRDTKAAAMPSQSGTPVQQTEDLPPQ